MQPHKVNRCFLDPSGIYHTNYITAEIGLYTHTKDDNGAGSTSIFSSLTNDTSRIHDKVCDFPDPLMELVSHPRERLETHT